jgi:phosphoribosylformylglycinamidine synthase subunit PurS
MKFKAVVDVMPQKEILDPKGKAVESALKSLSGSHVEQVRIGKRIEFLIEADSQELANSEVNALSKKLLANLIMEDFHVVLEKI